MRRGVCVLTDMRSGAETRLFFSKCSVMGFTVYLQSLFLFPSLPLDFLEKKWDNISQYSLPGNHVGLLLLYCTFGHIMLKNEFYSKSEKKSFWGKMF